MSSRLGGPTGVEAKYLRLLRDIAYEVALHDDGTSLFGPSQRIGRRLLRVVPPTYKVPKTEKTGCRGLDDSRRRRRGSDV